MSDSLQDFEAMFDPIILKRGQDYFLQGCVLEVEEIDKGQFSATVEGSEMYEVCVSLDAQGNILAVDCDCPYDWDAHCKHQAAVLFALREQLAQSESEPIQKQPPMLDDLRNTLAKQAKEKLADTLLFLARENPSLGKRMLIRLKGNVDP